MSTSQPVSKPLLFVLVITLTGCLCQNVDDDSVINKGITNPELPVQIDVLEETTPVLPETTIVPDLNDGSLYSTIVDPNINTEIDPNLKALPEIGSGQVFSPDESKPSFDSDGLNIDEVSVKNQLLKVTTVGSLPKSRERKLSDISDNKETQKTPDKLKDGILFKRFGLGPGGNFEPNGISVRNISKRILLSPTQPQWDQFTFNSNDFNNMGIDNWRPVWPFSKTVDGVNSFTSPSPTIPSRSQIPKTKFIPNPASSEVVNEQPVTDYYFDVASVIPQHAQVGPLFDKEIFEKNHPYFRLRKPTTTESSIHDLFPLESSFGEHILLPHPIHSEDDVATPNLPNIAFSSRHQVQSGVSGETNTAFNILTTKTDNPGDISSTSIALTDLDDIGPEYSWGNPNESIVSVISTALETEHPIAEIDSPILAIDTGDLKDSPKISTLNALAFVDTPNILRLNNSHNFTTVAPKITTNPITGVKATPTLSMLSRLPLWMILSKQGTASLNLNSPTPVHSSSLVELASENFQKSIQEDHEYLSDLPIGILAPSVPRNSAVFSSSIDPNQMDKGHIDIGNDSILQSGPGIKVLLDSPKLEGSMSSSTNDEKEQESYNNSLNNLENTLPLESFKTSTKPNPNSTVSKSLISISTNTKTSNSKLISSNLKYSSDIKIIPPTEIVPSMISNFTPIYPRTYSVSTNSINPTKIKDSISESLSSTLSNIINTHQANADNEHTPKDNSFNSHLDAAETATLFSSPDNDDTLVGDFNNHKTDINISLTGMPQMHLTTPSFDNTSIVMLSVNVPTEATATSQDDFEVGITDEAFEDVNSTVTSSIQGLTGNKTSEEVMNVTVHGSTVLDETTEGSISTNMLESKSQTISGDSYDSSHSTISTTKSPLFPIVFTQKTSLTNPNSTPETSVPETSTSSSEADSSTSTLASTTLRVFTIPRISTTAKPPFSETEDSSEVKNLTESSPNSEPTETVIKLTTQFSTSEQTEQPSTELTTTFRSTTTTTSESTTKSTTQESTTKSRTRPTTPESTTKSPIEEATTQESTIFQPMPDVQTSMPVIEAMGKEVTTRVYEEGDEKIIVSVQQSSGQEPELDLVKVHSNGSNSTQPFVKAALSYGFSDFCEHKHRIHALLREWLDLHMDNQSKSNGSPYEIEIFYQPDCDDSEGSISMENKTDVYFYVKENGLMSPNTTLTYPRNPTTLQISQELEYLKEKILHLELVSDSSPTVEDLLNEEVVGTSVVVVVVITALLVAVAMGALLAFLVIRRKRTSDNLHGRRCTPANDAYSLDSVSVYFQSLRRKSRKRQSNKSLKSYLNQAFEDPSGPTRPLNFAKLTHFISDHEGVYDEFSKIPAVVPNYDEMPRGVEEKNRYANVIPVPETRILLRSPKDSATLEYINANTIHGPRNELKYYIATQAPLDNTVADFWQMIWEQESKVIVMLTDFVEKGVDKCADYLPPSETLDCHRVYGDFQITLKSRDMREKYVASMVQIKNLENNLTREICHMWYTAWPHTGVPNEEKSFISFIFDMRAVRKQLRAKGPIVVHCSPGTGRTGTFCAIDLCMRQFDEQKVVDIPKTVYRIRRERAGAVQTKEQYAFIYRVVNLYAAKLTTGNLDSF